MNITNLTLFGFGILGVLLHNLVEINKLNKDPNKQNFTISSYLKTEWAAISISVLLVCGMILGKTYVEKLEQLKEWLGVVVFTAGYMGQSLLIAIMGKAQKVTDNITQ